MQSLEFAEIPAAALRAIAARHELPGDPIVRLPQVGVINAIYALGEGHVLRVPRAHPGAVAQARAELVAAPAARAAGVRTPRLVAWGEAGDGLGVPYLIYERARGRNLGLLAWEPVALAPVWRALGHDLALLHAAPLAAGLRVEAPGADPRALAEARVADVQPQDILPVQAGVHGVGGLAVGQPRGELQDRREREPPRSQGGLPAPPEERRERVISEDLAERIRRMQIRMAFREGRAGDPDGGGGDGRQWPWREHRPPPADEETQTTFLP